MKSVEFHNSSAWPIFDRDAGKARDTFARGLYYRLWFVYDRINHVGIWEELKKVVLK